MNEMLDIDRTRQVITDIGDQISTAVNVSKERAERIAADEELFKCMPGQNILINSYFIGGGSQQGGGQFPINQRGNVSSTKDGYFIDRWTGGGTGHTFSIESDCIRITSAGNTSSQYNMWFRQYVENYKQLIGKTITFSCVYRNRASAPTDDSISSISVYFGREDTAESTRLPFSDDWALGTITTTVRDDATNFGATFAVLKEAKGSIDIMACKLELGDHQTLAHQDDNGEWVLNDPPPNFSSEMLKCQRYTLYIDHGVVNGSDTTIAFGLSNGAEAFIYSSLPAPMRVKPVIESSSCTLYRGTAGERLPVTSLATWSFGNNAVWFRATTSSTLVARQICCLQGRLIINAEL